jgi:hypothetical protein
VIALFVLSILASNTTYGPLLWPLPHQFTIGNSTFSVNPCTIDYRVPTTPVYFKEIVDFYLTDVFKCKKSLE